MKCITAFFLMLLPTLASADSPGKQGFDNLHRCVMQNDQAYCRSILTADSAVYYDRFSGYKLMPCLSTDFTYIDEKASGASTTVKATMPAGGGKLYVIRLIFAVTPSGPLLDLPATFQRGLGQNWQNNIEMSEQLYRMMKQNMGDSLTCDMLTNLIKPAK